MTVREVQHGSADLPGSDADAGLLRKEVRAALAEAAIEPYAMCDAWMRGHDEQFTRTLARHGLIGVSWPREYGGRDAGARDRLVITEELLRVGAPVAAHWIADRQIGPSILRHGSAELRREYLPRIAAGEYTFCLGMSESESGSDLAAVRTRAVRDGDHYRLSGTKIWTSHAHRTTHAYVLARTDSSGAKHEGLTEFVVDLSTPGIQIRPIYDLAGQHHFNEVHFDDVVVPDGNVIGEVGQGWRQVTEQLAFERGGMERVLSTFPLLARVLDRVTPVADPAELGSLVARLCALRAMAFDVAAAMDRGEAPVHRSAMLKYLGNAFEYDVVEFARTALASSPDPLGNPFSALVADAVTAAPGASIRGGATEVLLTIIGRQELQHARVSDDVDELRRVVDDVLGGRERQKVPAELDDLWRNAVHLGWTGVGVAESAGGSGGDLADLAAIAAGLARHGFSAPVVETALCGRLSARAGRRVDPTRPAAPALGEGVRAETDGSTVRLSGRMSHVPWAASAAVLVVAADCVDGELLVELPVGADGLTVSSGRNIAGEPRDTVVFNGVTVASTNVLGGADSVAEARRTASILRTAGIVGALDAAHSSATNHVTVRHQFDKPLASFQAVAHGIAKAAAEVALAKTVLEQALNDQPDSDGWRAAAAAVVAARAATAVARTAHQLLGAMGITREHDLHLATLRLWSWRDEGVAEAVLARRLGMAALEAGENATWDWCVQEAARLSERHLSPWKDNMS